MTRQKIVIGCTGSIMNHKKRRPDKMAGAFEWPEIVIPIAGLLALQHKAQGHNLSFLANKRSSSWASRGNAANTIRKLHSAGNRSTVPKARMRNGISVTANWRRKPVTRATNISLLCRWCIRNTEVWISRMPMA